MSASCLVSELTCQRVGLSATCLVSELTVSELVCQRDVCLPQLEQLDKSLDNIAELTRNNPGAMIVVAGDFNAGSIDWKAGIVPPGARSIPSARKCWMSALLMV